MWSSTADTWAISRQRCGDTTHYLLALSVGYLPGLAIYRDDLPALAGSSATLLSASMTLVMWSCMAA